MTATTKPTTSLPPTVPGMPIVGSALQFVSHNSVSVDFLQKVQREYGDLVQFKAMNRSFCLISDPELIREVLLERAQEFVKPEAVFQDTRGLARFLGHGILTAGYDEWRPQRKLIQPLMQHGQITHYAETMTAMGDKLVAGWQSGEQRNIHADMTQVTMWIIAEAIFGITVERSAQFEQIVNDAQKIIVDDLASPAPAWLTKRDQKAAQINAQLTDLVNQFVTERRTTGTAGRSDLLSVLMEARDAEGVGLSDELLRDNILTMFFAGHETTANTLTWAFYFLSQNPAVLEALEYELDTVLTDGRLPTVEDLPNLPYTLMVIKETLRIQPTVAMLVRMATQDTTLGGYALKQGTFVLISPYVLHHDARRWSQPEVYDPARFDPETGVKLDKYGYMPFGAGPRICIGNHFALMEAQLLLALIASRYRLYLAPGANVQPLRQVTTSPRSGLPMIVQRRG
ncbi:MAG: cytochrome P450 [Anaerolineae bacterium]